jgi:hypothetical protein
MADIETSVVISAQTDGLQSGMEVASNSVQTATAAMRAQLAALGTAAQQVQTQLDAAAGRIGSGVSALQTKTAGLAGSVGESISPYAVVSQGGYGGSGIPGGGGDGLAALSTRGGEAAEDEFSAMQKLWGEERLGYQKFLLEREQLDFQAVQSSQRTWQGLMQPIQRAFDTSITGMILGTTTLQRAVANITQSIIAEFVNLGVRMVTNWIASELAMTTATQAGAAARTAAESEGITAGLAIKALNAVKSIVTDSAQAFAGIFAFLAPIMGPAAAGPAAAGEAAVLAAAGGIASAAGGWVVPSDQLAMVHQNEMILPAHISQGLQGVISANSSAVAGAGPVVINVSAIDSQDVKRFFHNNGSLLVAAVNKAMRNGSSLRTA